MPWCHHRADPIVRGTAGPAPEVHGVPGNDLAGVAGAPGAAGVGVAAERRRRHQLAPAPAPQGRARPCAVLGTDVTSGASCHGAPATTSAAAGDKTLYSCATPAAGKVHRAAAPATSSGRSPVPEGHATMTQLSYRPGDLDSIAPSVDAVGACGVASARLRLDAVAASRRAPRPRPADLGAGGDGDRGAVDGVDRARDVPGRRAAAPLAARIELIWPRAVARNPTLTGAAEVVRSEHRAAVGGLPAPRSSRPRAKRPGSVSAEHRLLVRDAVGEVAAALPTVFGATWRSQQSRLPR